MPDYYSILGVLPTAEDVVIRGAYKGLAQKYHPDRFEGDPQEANIKMAELNEAKDVLLDPLRRKEYDANRKTGSRENDAGSDVSFIVVDEKIPEIPQIAVSNISSQIVYSEPQLSLAEAQALFQQKFEKSKKKLPKDTNLMDVTSKTRLFFVPYWWISGSASGEWRATGVNIDITEINCKKCGGKGTTGGGKNRRTCSICHGSGSVNRQKSRKETESGNAEAYVNEVLSDNASEIKIQLDLPSDDRPKSPSHRMLSEWYCIQPVHVDAEEMASNVSEILSHELRKKARSQLSHYDQVEGLHFNDVRVDFVNATFWLCPVYICWYQRKRKKYFAFCDAITGEVVTPETKSIWALIWKFIKVLFIALILMLTVMTVVTYFVNRQSPTSAITNQAQIEAPAIPQSSNTTTHVEQAEKAPENQSLAEDPVNQTNVVSENRPSTSSNVTPSVGVDSPENTQAPINSGEAFAPSFDCAKATIQVEKIICSSKELAEADLELSKAFQTKLHSTTFGIFKKQLKDDQSNWMLEKRNVCQDEACLLNVYKERINELIQPPKASATCSIPGHC